MERDLTILAGEIDHQLETRSELTSILAELSLLAEVYRQTHFLDPHYTREAQEASTRRFPYVRRFVRGDISFRFLIANLEGRAWYEPDLLAVSQECPELVRMCSPGDRVLEIGSHHGFTGTLLAHCGQPDVTVLGLECHPGCALIARAQTLLNGCERRLRFVNAAGSDRPGSVEISLSAGAGLVETDRPTGVSIPAVPGDLIDRRIGPISYLKIDVEGYEMQVLRGCRSILSRAPKLALELHMDQLPRYGASVQEVLDGIGVERYEGTMLVRADSGTAQDVLRPFDRNAIPHSGVANLFLSPRIVPSPLDPLPGGTSSAPQLA